MYSDLSTKPSIFHEDVAVIKSGYLEVSDLHQIYYEVCGKKSGIPIIYLHGGPGAGFSEKNKRYFNPEKYQSIFFDQRGCGRSLPLNELRENTTTDLIQDMEKLRLHLGVEKWILFGGSWGSTLALSYAIKHPEHVLGMVLYGIFLANQENVDLLHGPHSTASIFFPEVAEKEHQRFLGKGIHQAYAEITSTNKTVAISASVDLLLYEGALCGMDFNNKKEEQARLEAEKSLSTAEKKSLKEGFEAFAFTHSLLESHYTINRFFMEEHYILNNAHKLKDIPLQIIHGRYDMICPPKFAWALHKAVPKSKIQFIPHAGHSGSEMGQELMHALEALSPFIQS